MCLNSTNCASQVKKDSIFEVKIKCDLPFAWGECELEVGILLTWRWSRWRYEPAPTRRRQPETCARKQTGLGGRTQLQNPQLMARSSCNSTTIIAILVGFFLLAHSAAANHTHGELLLHLSKINRPPSKTISSPDGDLIDCVASHLQPAFDHPLLRGQKPMEPPERPKDLNFSHGWIPERFQKWMDSGEACPDGTIPIRRTREEDLLRVSKMGMYGRKKVVRLRRDSSGGGHEHAVGYAMGGQFYGAKASLNVWAPKVTSPSEFSLSQIWIISGSFGQDLNTIEAGWQVSPDLYGDDSPRFFTYWTSDAYQTTGCYNLLCSGFIQTNNRIAIGAAISPISSYSGGQFDISIMVWKDPKHGHWWLEFGQGLLVGYWPSVLFSHLAEHANMVQFGGEIVNTHGSGVHTSTQMGSGHFAGEGFRKASYFRNIQVVDWDNSLIPLPQLKFLADHPNCYDIRGGRNSAWGYYFYYGGPGRNVRCT